MSPFTRRHEPIPEADEYPMQTQHWDRLWQELFKGKPGEAAKDRIMLIDLFENIPQRHQDVIKLYYSVGSKKTAQIVGTTTGAVVDWRNRGLQELRCEFSRYQNRNNPRISDLRVRVRTANALDRLRPPLNDYDWERLRNMSDSELLKLKNFGRKSLKELDDCLEDMGIPRYPTLKKRVDTANANARPISRKEGKALLRKLLDRWSASQLLKLLAEELERRETTP